MRLFQYAIVVILGLMLAHSVEMLSPPKANAIAPTEIPIPIPKPDQFRLDIDLNTGTSTILSNRSFDKSEVNVKHPTKVVEKVVVKPVIKERIKVKTETQVRTNTVLFTLPTAKIHVPVPVLPNRVEL